MTIGTPHCPFDRYRMRAASCTIWSNAGVEKSANWISAIGRKPARASPMATPTIADSARGRVDGNDHVLAARLRVVVAVLAHRAAARDGGQRAGRHVERVLRALRLESVAEDERARPA